MSALHLPIVCLLSLSLSFLLTLFSLCLLQAWADAFRSSPDLTGVVQIYEELKRKGIEFPMSELETLSPIHTPQRVGGIIRSSFNVYRSFCAKNKRLSSQVICLILLHILSLSLSLLGSICSRGRLHPTEVQRHYSAHTTSCPTSLHHPSGPQYSCLWIHQSYT